MCDFTILQAAGASKIDGIEIFLTPMEAAEMVTAIKKALNQLTTCNVHLLVPGNRKVIIRVVKDSEDLTKRTLHQKEN